MTHTWNLTRTYWEKIISREATSRMKEILVYYSYRMNLSPLAAHTQGAGVM